jgi:type I restriction enzyme S subunit
MANDWDEIALADVMDVKHGFAFPGLNIRDEPPGDILLTPGNFAIGGGFKRDKFKYFDGEVPADYVLSEGDLIVTMTDLSKQADTLGFPALVPKPGGPRFLHNQRLGKVLIKQSTKLDKGFLFYLLRTAEYRHEVLASATGTTVKHTSPGRILAHKTNLPPLAEQKAIAAVLSALDYKIELNRRMNATLEAIVRALFQSWFVDFDPVHAKMDGREPAGIDQATAALFPDSLQHSELGNIPNGWTLRRVDDVCHFSRSSINPGNFPGETFDHYSLPAFDAGRTPKAELGSVIMSNKLVVTRNSVLLSKLNPHIPRIWLADLHVTRRSLCSTEFIVALPKSGYSREFLFSLFTSTAFSSTYRTLVTGTTGSHQRVGPESVLEMRTIIPPPQLVEAFTTIAKPMFDEINHNIDQSRTLAQLRDTLLPKLLSGEIRVPEAESLAA